MEIKFQISFFFLFLWQVSLDFANPENEKKSENSGIISNPNEESIIPEFCPKNMILHSDDDNSSNGICDCESGFLYDSVRDSCHEAYRQGPCPPENYFILPPGEISGKCEKNPCLEDGLVFFQGSCARLWEYVPACADNTTKLSVKKNNFELECIKPEELVSFFASRLNIPTKDCPKGSKRMFLGKCKHVFE